MGKRLLLMRAFQIKIPEQSFKLGQLDTPFMKLRSSLRHVGYGNAVAPFVVRRLTAKSICLALRVEKVKKSV